MDEDELGTHRIDEWLGWMPRFEPLVREATAPIYLRLENGRLHALGSGVFIALGERRFLITAAHVADDMLDGRPELGFGNALAPTSARFITTILPASGNRNHDRFDIAVAEMDPQELIDKRITAVPPRAFEIGEDAYGEDLFLAAGYPYTKQTPRVVNCVVRWVPSGRPHWPAADPGTRSDEPCRPADNRAGPAME